MTSPGAGKVLEELSGWRRWSEYGYVAVTIVQVPGLSEWPGGVPVTAS